MADEPTPRPSAGALGCLTDDGVGRDGVNVVAQSGSGSGDDRTFLATPGRLQAAFNPSIRVDFDVPGEEDGAR